MTKKKGNERCKPISHYQSNFTTISDNSQVAKLGLLASLLNSACNNILPKA